MRYDILLSGQAVQTKLVHPCTSQVPAQVKTHGSICLIPTGGAVRANSGLPSEPATPGHTTAAPAQGAGGGGGEPPEPTCCPLLVITDEELRVIVLQVGR
jgi:hypothetical protein